MKKHILFTGLQLVVAVPIFAQSSDRATKGLANFLAAMFFFGIIALWRAYKANRSNRD